jgi:molybdopterin molybdotransferase
MAGRMGDAALLGLPGNPVSALVCGHLFPVPMLRAFLGLKAPGTAAAQGAAGRGPHPNGPREHYMRAEVFPTGEVPEIVPFDRQDSSLLSILSRANGLLVRPVGDPARKAGELVDYVPIGPIAPDLPDSLTEHREQV